MYCQFPERNLTSGARHEVAVNCDAQIDETKKRAAIVSSGKFDFAAKDKSQA